MMKAKNNKTKRQKTTHTRIGKMQKQRVMNMMINIMKINTRINMSRRKQKMMNMLRTNPLQWLRITSPAAITRRNLISIWTLEEEMMDL
jgi:hypothetical protein